MAQAWLDQVSQSGSICNDLKSKEFVGRGKRRGTKHKAGVADGELILYRKMRNEEILALGYSYL